MISAWYEHTTEIKILTLVASTCDCHHAVQLAAKEIKHAPPLT